MALPDPPVLLSHVTLRYENGTQALEDVSLSIRPGEHLCVLGANGSGKSTLASVICGLLAPDEGVVSLFGERAFDSARRDPVDFKAYRRARRSLGLVFQNPDDQMVTTVVEEDVAFGPENLGVSPEEIGLRVERELRRVAMQDFAKADPTKLSGGQKQRVAIAGALAMEPRVLVLDEPGSLLDVRGRLAIMRVMGRLHQAGTTLVHITHFMEEALEADRVVVLSHGRIVLEGSPCDVFSHARELVALGLDEPFVARLSRRLGLPWTCNKDDLVREICSRASADAKMSPQTGPLDPTRGNKVEKRAQNDADFPLCSVLDRPNLTKWKKTPNSGEDFHFVRSVIAQEVTYSYSQTQKALDAVSFLVREGQSVAIVGHTGSGKSTLLRLLCALEAPDAGIVQVNGIRTTKRRDRRKLHGTIGYVMQQPERQLFAETVLEDVAFGPRNLGLTSNEVSRRCQHALDLVGLTGLDDASPFELSGGQQRLCAIAGILAMQPGLLVLDEPMAGLDPRGRRDLRKLLDDLHDHGVTTIQVTHTMEDAVRCEHVVVLNRSRVMFAGNPHEVFCAAHATELAKAGLGLPAPLDFALALERAGMPAAPNGTHPLTMDDLTAFIQEAVGIHGA